MTTNNEVAGFVTGYDKMAHMLAFLVESWLFVRMFASDRIQFPFGHRFYDLSTGTSSSQGCISVNKYVASLVICSVCAAIGSEYLQKILSLGRRSFDPMDIVFNVVGSLTGIAIAYHQER